MAAKIPPLVKYVSYGASSKFSHVSYNVGCHTCPGTRADPAWPEPLRHRGLGGGGTPQDVIQNFDGTINVLIVS